MPTQPTIPNMMAAARPIFPKESKIPTGKSQPRKARAKGAAKEALAKAKAKAKSYPKAKSAPHPKGEVESAHPAKRPRA